MLGAVAASNWRSRKLTVEHSTKTPMAIQRNWIRSGKRITGVLLGAAAVNARSGIVAALAVHGSTGKFGQIVQGQSGNVVV